MKQETSMLKKDTPSGVIIYEGPSLVDGKPIVVIANSLKTNKNRKIGDMIQTWILRSDIHPQEALKSGDDHSICGECMHRGVYEKDTDTVKDRTCYVNLYQQGVFAIFNAYKRGSYPTCEFKHMQLFNGRHIRIGSYGDPAAVPIYVWNTIAKSSKDYTGYTHLWRSCDDGYRSFCMASCETVDDYKLATSMGWRTFRVINDQNEARDSKEIPCPAQIKDVHCDKCTFCDGSNPHKKNVTVVFHGAQGRDKAYLRKLAMSA
jgi:hypothetical protein